MENNIKTDLNDPINLFTANDTATTTLKYIEVDEKTNKPTGRSAYFCDVDFQALQYSDLLSRKLNNKVNIPLIWKNARVLESNIPEITVEEFASGSTTLESTYSAKTIGLVNGGWLPSGLALQNKMIVLPDRCTVSELVGRFGDGAKKNAHDEDFLDLFADKHIRVSPILYALEGNARTNPTPLLVQQQLEEAHTKIKSALPLAELIPKGKDGLKGIIGIINDTQAGIARKQDFLVRLAPQLKAPISAKKFAQTWDDVLLAADDCRVPRRSLVVLAALSAITVPNGKSPAKRLLKLATQNYTAEHAYNALADLRSLELLMHFFALFPKERFLLCTGDKDLALFWTGIRVSNLEWNGSHLHYKLSPVEALLPNIACEQKASYFAE